MNAWVVLDWCCYTYNYQLTRLYGNMMGFALVTIIHEIVFLSYNAIKEEIILTNRKLLTNSVQ